MKRNNKDFLFLLIFVTILIIIFDIKLVNGQNSLKEIENKVNEIYDKYHIKIYFNENPIEKYGIKSSKGKIKLEDNYILMHYSDISNYLNIIEQVFSNLNSNIKSEFPDIYLCELEDVNGLAFRSDQFNFIILKVEASEEDFIKQILYHELFHIFTIKNMNIKKTSYKFILDNVEYGFYEAFSQVEEEKGVISEYAKTNLLECMAEAFAYSIVDSGKRDNEYFRVMREYAWGKILNSEFIEELQNEN